MTSAGALVTGLKTRGAKRISLVAPYMKPLTCLVVDYIEAEGITVVDSIALEIPDNLEVGRRDPMALVSIYRDLNSNGVDALVLSSCVQMPSLAAISVVEQQCGLACRAGLDLHRSSDASTARLEDIRAGCGGPAFRKILAVIFLHVML